MSLESYVLSRTYKGIQQPIDTISATGKAPKYSEQVNGINKSIIQLRGKTNELERNVEETRSEIKDVESGLDTKITQTAGKIELEAKRAIDAEVELAAAISVQADQIKLKVSKGDVSSQLSIESGQVSISGDRFVLSATNCSITKEGKITAKDVDLSGKITASSGNIAGFTIASQVVKYLATAEYAPETEGNNLVIDIQRVLSGLVKNIENQEFDNLYIKHKYEKVEELYGEDIKNMMKQMTVETLKKKFKYLEKVVWEKENTEIHEIKREMKDLIVRKEKVTRIRQQLNELSKVYDKSVEDYKNITLKQLRVPLLIYTGKILQDYQNGLGVFVSKDEMRFTGDDKSDRSI